MSRKEGVIESNNGGFLKVRKNRRVTLHYRVTLASGEEFDASEPNSPLQITCGRGETIQGLEKRLLGMEAGEHKQFVIPPEEAFGPHDARLMKRISLEELSLSSEPNVGTMVPVRDKGTEVVCRIVDVHADEVTADFNHPLAGQSLYYDVTILEVDEPQSDPLFN
ncbi:MAG: peptidylprolyl isomerase [Myxococcales bacterium]|nr:peptidylprolyl isomerase [Myxococcales bacterium]